MRVLLDEQLPRQLVPELTGHEVRTVQQQGWAGLTNGELLRRAADEGLEVLLTADQNLEFQQNLARSRLGIIILVARVTPLRISFPWFPASSLRFSRASRARWCALLPNPRLERTGRRLAHHSRLLRAARRSTAGRYANGERRCPGRCGT